MPGAYAHIALIQNLSARQELYDLPEEARAALTEQRRYCELGAVSPDYPMLATGNRAANAWADTMHANRSGEMVQAAVEQIHLLSGTGRLKALAWLLGYVSHIAADAAIHPVVDTAVSDMADPMEGHRICEMHQDAYIVRRTMLGALGMSEHLYRGICACSGESVTGRLDPVVHDLWSEMLRTVHPREFADNPPDIQRWHKRFRALVDVGELEGRMTPLARHVSVGLGMTYPDPNAIDYRFIENLPLPGGSCHYDELFDAATDHIGHLWVDVAAGACGGGSRGTGCLRDIGSRSPDSARDARGQLLFRDQCETARRRSYGR